MLDDEPQVLAAIEDTLEGDFRVLVHTSPQAAIGALEREPELAVIVSDQRMPQMNGDEFLSRASALSDASRLMITGYADLEAVVRAVNNGRIFGYISKPWDPAALKLTIFKAAEHHRLLRELSDEKRFFGNLMDNIPDAIFFKDREHRFLRLNREHAARLGVARPEDVVGRPTGDFFPAEEAHEREQEDEEIARSGVPLADKVRRIATRDGAFRWRSTTKAPVKDDKGQVIGLVGISRDITRRREAEEGVRRLNRVYAMLSGINSLIVRVLELSELYQGACRIAVEAGNFRMAWVGTYDPGTKAFTPAACEGHDDGFLRLVAARMNGPTGQEGPLVRRAMRIKHVVVINDIEQDRSFPLRDEALARGYRSGAALPLVVAGEIIGVLGLFAVEPGFFDDAERRLLDELAGDIAFAVDHVQKSERLDYLAYYDPLTGLANRTLFLEHVAQSCAAQKDAGHRVAVMMLDIDRFKNINDALGRHGGDALLKQVAERLRKHALGRTQFARIGADRFAVMVPDAGGDDEVARRIDTRLGELFDPPFQVGEAELRLSAKVGAALFPTDGADADTLLHNAEAALKRAKRSGEKYLFFSEDMTSRVAEHLRLEGRLRQGLEREEFLLHYQPKIDLASRRIVGLEALIRWMADGELVPPMRFIPLMEETGLILEVGAWALRRAARDHHSLVQRGLPAPRIAVNVSSIQLRKRDFVDTVNAALKQGVSPPGIDLEITESVAMEGIEENVAKLTALRELGMRIAIDDFGTGYSSLGYLARLPVHALKIDRSFIVRMLDDPNTMTLVSTMISMAHSLKLEVVAEGVETEEQAKMLRLLRCDQMQGYLFSKPLPLEAVTALLGPLR